MLKATSLHFVVLLYAIYVVCTRDNVTNNFVFLFVNDCDLINCVKVIVLWI